MTISKCCKICKEYDYAKEWCNIRQEEMKPHFGKDCTSFKEMTVKEALGEVKGDEILNSIVNLKDAMREGVPKTEWVVQNLIPERGVCFIAGSPGCYKSFLAQHLSMCVAEGKPFVKQFCTIQGTVLYVDEENGQAVLLRRYQQIGYDIAPSDFPEEIKLCVFQNIWLDTEEGQATLKKIVIEIKPALVILDSMVRLMQGAEDKSQDVRMVFDTLKDVMESHTCAFVILHHLRKGSANGMDALRGSGDFAAMSDTILLLQPTKNAIRTTMIKNRHIPLDEVQSFKIRIENPQGFEDSIQFEYEGLLPKVEDRAERVASIISEWLRSNHVDSFKSQDVINVCRTKGIVRSGVYDGLDKLCDEGVIAKSGRGQFKVNRLLLDVDKQDVL